ncbi:MAG TPA: hypothetical protein VL155_08700 [Terriglobales bacterium]|jgi:hypothetical protein|nr:hypothetical protein [Terriglobales bacterium]
MVVVLAILFVCASMLLIYVVVRTEQVAQQIVELPALIYRADVDFAYAIADAVAAIPGAVCRPWFPSA